MPVRRSPLLAAAILAAFVAPTSSAIAAELAGRVTEAASGRPLPNATVRVPSLGRTVTSDRAGEYRFADLPPGEYSIEVEYVGFGVQTETVRVDATGVTELSFALREGTATDLEEVLVTGYRLAQLTALQDKRMANMIKESVTADDAGKLPDQNAAEALRRVTGVSVTIDQGEGRYVTVRGIDPSYTNVTIDNQVIGTPEGDTRRVALDTIPAELLSKLEVIKSVTPDMDGNSVGGSVNIVTPSVFDDPDGRFFTATADIGYYDLNEETPYGAAAGWGQTFGADGEWGVVLSGSYSERDFDSENLQGGDPWEEEGDFLVPDALVLRDYAIERKRKGFVANFEYRPSDTRYFYFRNLYNRFEDVELQSEVVWDYRSGDLLDQTPTSGTFTEGEGERLISERREIQSIQTSSLGTELTFGRWQLALSGTYGESEQDTPYEREWSFALDEEQAMTYDTASFFFTVDGGPGFHDADRYEFNEHARGGQIVEEELKVAQLDLARAFDASGWSMTLKFGGKYVDRDKTSDQDLTVYDGFDGDLLLTPFAEPGKSDFYCDEQCYTYGPRVNYGGVEDFFDGNSAGFEVNDADTVAESFGVDYDLSEEVSAGYVMGTFELGAATIVGGVRVESTDSEFQGYDLLFEDGDVAQDPAEVTGSKSYTNWLPGVQVRYAATDDLIMRAAWTNTIGRPSYETTVPFRIFDIEPDDDVFEGSVEAGNPDLEPLESMNLDASVEWYLDAGIVAGGVFYKDIDNPIVTRFQNLEDVEFEGRQFSELEIFRPENAESGEIFGVELNYQQQFRDLPSPFDGLGIAANYTYSDSEATAFDRDDDIPFFLQSEHVGNLTLFYQKGGFEMRIAYSYRSEYLDTLGEGPETDLWIDDHGQLDMKASYDFTEHLTAFFQVQNLTDEPLRYLSGTGRLLAESEFYSWNALAGVQVKF